MKKCNLTAAACRGHSFLHNVSNEQLVLVSQSQRLKLNEWIWGNLWPLLITKHCKANERVSLSVPASWSSFSQLDFFLLFLFSRLIWSNRFLIIYYFFHSSVQQCPFFFFRPVLFFLFLAFTSFLIYPSLFEARCLLTFELSPSSHFFPFFRFVFSFPSFCCIDD